jgi:hypothetical protein
VCKCTAPLNGAVILRLFLPEYYLAPSVEQSWWGFFLPVLFKPERRSRLEFSGVVECHDQNSLTALVVNPDNEVILLLWGQIIPVRNNLHENLCHSQSDLTGSFNIRQIIGSGVPDPIVLTTNKESVLGHGQGIVAKYLKPTILS